jgi:hypothetical protein
MPEGAAGEAGATGKQTGAGAEAEAEAEAEASCATLAAFCERRYMDQWFMESSDGTSHGSPRSVSGTVVAT